MPCVLAALLALGGWLVPWQYDAGMAGFDRSRGAIEDVFLFAARLDRDGHPVLDERGDDWSRAVERVHAAGSRAWLTIVNDRVSGSAAIVLKDPEVVHRVLADGDLRREHRSEILALAKRVGVDGVDLDYENLPSWERDAFTGFVRELASELRAHGLAVSVTTQPKWRDTVSRGPGAMDWRGLCAVTDRLQVMLYNEHNASTEPGPVASLDWTERVVDYGLGACPAAKLVPVVKVSGMDWGPGKAEWRSFAEVSSVIARERPRMRRERYNRVPWFVYRAADGRHVVYFEDARSLSAKADRLRERGLTTLVLWSLGSEDPEAIGRLASGAGAGQKR